MSIPHMETIKIKDKKIYRLLVQKEIERSNMRPTHVVIILISCLVAALALAELPSEWGEGKKQEDGSIVYKRVFQIPATHWEPSDITNYYAKLEHTELHIAEGKSGKYLHIMYSLPIKHQTNQGSSSNERTMVINRDDNKIATEMKFHLGEYLYVDFDVNGKLDLLHDNKNEKSFIILEDSLLRVKRKRTIDQDIQTSFQDNYVYKFRNGTWVLQENH